MPVLCRLLLVSLSLQCAAADELRGVIVGVIDGDTVDLLTVQKVLYRVRLAGIDAPEKGQPFGQAAKRALSTSAFSQSVVVTWSKVDRYHRIIGKIQIGSKDLSYELVANGFAWHYKKYEAEQTESDRKKYAIAELAARQSRVGLWSDREVEAPWDYRKRRKTPARNLK